MIHGFPGQSAGQSNLYGDMEFVLADKGYHALRFDFRGCGQSDGDQANFTCKKAGEDINAVLNWAQEQGYERFIYMSEGLGTTIAIMNMPPSKLIGQIMLWPGLNLPYLAKSLFKANDITPEDEKTGYVRINDNKIGVPFIKELQTIKFGNFMRDVTMPVLIMQGAQDRLFPVEQIDLARKHMSPKRIDITTFQDGDHGLLASNHRKMMIFHIGQFLQKYV